MTATHQAVSCDPWAVLTDCPAESVYWASLGYAAGYEEGRADELAEIGRAGLQVVEGGVPILKKPTHAELLDRRRATNGPCRDHCGSCSRCIRAFAAGRNLALYGAPDFPGVAVATWLAEAP